MELTAAQPAEHSSRLDTPDADEPLTPEEWEELWAVEIERRMADLEAGRTKLVPWEDFKASMAERINRVKPENRP